MSEIEKIREKVNASVWALSGQEILFLIDYIDTLEQKVKELKGRNKRLHDEVKKWELLTKELEASICDRDTEILNACDLAIAATREEDAKVGDEISSNAIDEADDYDRGWRAGAKSVSANIRKLKEQA